MKKALLFLFVACMTFVGCQKDDDYSFTAEENTVLNVLTGRFKSETSSSMHCLKFTPYSAPTQTTVHRDNKDQDRLMYGTIHEDNFYTGDEEYQFDYVFELNVSKKQLVLYMDWGSLLGYIYDKTYNYEIINNNTIKLTDTDYELTREYSRY